MIGNGMTSPTLPVGDARRPTIGRAVVGALALAAAFLVYIWIAKETRPLYVHTPWADDPYDAVVSFAFFFVPITAALCLLRVPLCLRAEPLPVARARALLRGSRITVAIVGITLLSEWMSVVLGVNRTTWTEATAVLVSVLALMSVATVAVTVELWRASRQTPDTLNDGGPDWVADVVSVGERFSYRIGPLGVMLRRLLKVVERDAIPVVRAHPFADAAAVSVGFGALLAMGQSAAEEGFAWRAVLLFATVAACSMFAFLLAVGAHLRLLGERAPLPAASRRTIEAAVVGAATVPVTLAFRTALRWIVGPALGPAHVLQVSLLIALLAAAIVFAAETLVNRHE